jgi:serine/threonine protein kinase
MSRPRSSAGYGRPKSNSGHGGERNDVQVSDVATSSRAKSTDKSKRQIVGQYMIGKTIGEGTFGKVKLAVHIPTGEKVFLQYNALVGMMMFTYPPCFLQVAIKILEKSRIKEQADVRRVNREIKILKKSRHGNIIQLYEVLDTKNTIYLIMECCEGSVTPSVFSVLLFSS